MLRKRNYNFIGLIVLALLALPIIAACNGNGNGDDPPPDEKPTPQEHTATVSVFDTTINVKGDASISDNDFNTAVAKLQEVMDYYDGLANNTTFKINFKNVVNRSGNSFEIIIQTGNAAPDVDADRNMTIGVNFVNDNEYTNFALAFRGKVEEGVFAD
jgi:hypothetical protein